MKVVDIYQKNVYAVFELSIEEVRELLSVLENTQALHSGNEHIRSIRSELRKAVEAVDGT